MHNFAFCSLIYYENVFTNVKEDTKITPLSTSEHAGCGSEALLHVSLLSNTLSFPRFPKSESADAQE